MAKVSNEQYREDAQRFDEAKRFVEAYRPPDALPPGMIVRDLEELRSAHAFAHLNSKAESNADSQANGAPKGGAADELLKGIQARTQAQIPTAPVHFYANLAAVSHMAYILGDTPVPIGWTRTRFLSWTCREPSGPLPAAAWKDPHHWVIGMSRALSVEPSGHPVRPYLHKVAVAFLQVSDLLTYPLDPPEFAEMAEDKAAGWVPAIYTAPLGVPGDLNTTIFLRGVPTLDLRQAVQWMVGSWIAGGRVGTLPWSRREA